MADLDRLPPSLRLPQQLQLTARAAATQVREAARRTALTYPQAAVMATLWQQPMGIPVGAVCQNLGLSSATVSPVLRRLHERGLVTKEPALFDARGTIVASSPAGDALREAVSEALEVTMAADRLTPDERDRLVELLSVVTDRLRAAVSLERWTTSVELGPWAGAAPSRGPDVNEERAGRAGPGDG